MSELKDKIEAIKASVSIVRLLNDLGIRCSENTETQIRCFGHDELRPSARVYSRTNSVYCWVCHRSWDVVSAYQTIKDSARIADAVEELIVFYSVKVEQRPQQIQNFYHNVRNYVHGDPQQTDEILHDYGRSFQRFYEGIVGYQFIQDRIDYCWQEFDALMLGSLDSNQKAEAVSAWFMEATQFIESHRELCSALKLVEERAVAQGLK